MRCLFLRKKKSYLNFYYYHILKCMMDFSLYILFNELYRNWLGTIYKVNLRQTRIIKPIFFSFSFFFKIKFKLGALKQQWTD